MDQMEDLKISLIIFKEKEISFHFSKIDCVIKISSAESVCHICPLEFVITFRLKNLRPRGLLWLFEAIRPRGY